MNRSFSRYRLIAILILPASVFGQMQKSPNQTSADDCSQPSAVQLSAAQMKALLRHTDPISSPLLWNSTWNSMRITNAVLVFKVSTDQDGNVVCVRAISGHPIIIGAAIQSIKTWKFQPTTVGRRRQPTVGTLILAVSATGRGIETKVLREEPTPK